ncbi:hypothetical protein [Mesobacillus zeae]|uniref:VOC domain-containing protein n=1 Tax=Mesobacillus zeae TaxID=1917180 RepID=A0A398AX84_9BACI|nr:hypothetical protein [Mesobacillus zeae]RID82279.1 hypothetical protein D1970_19820 [Mesobacillus zeae]
MAIKASSVLKEGGLDEIDFKGRTQANACYFEDPAGNIVEYIARRDTSSKSNKREFSLNSVLSLSEISLSTDQIRKYAEQIKSLGIPVRDYAG